MAPNIFGKLREVLSYQPVSGAASPNKRTFFDSALIPLADVMKLYERDPTCKASVDLLAASTVGMGFYNYCRRNLMRRLKKPKPPLIISARTSTWTAC
jgi:hypothetical protein